jgi:NitT/TauT family transport system ATP-binding protein
MTGADVVGRLVRALERAAQFVADPANLEDVAALVAAPARLAVSRTLIRRTLEGNLKLSPDGRTRTCDRYLIIGRAGASRPESGAGGMVLCPDGALGTGTAVA